MLRGTSAEAARVLRAALIEQDRLNRELFKLWPWQRVLAERLAQKGKGGT